MTLRNWMVGRLSVLTAVIWLSIVPGVVAQDAVPGEILHRTVLVKAGDEAGTAFYVDFEGKLYLVTARHVVAGLPERNATIQVRHGDTWEDVHAARILFPPSGDADIAVLATDEKAEKPFEISVGWYRRPDLRTASLVLGLSGGNT
jgi:hypothetical protein